MNNIDRIRQLIKEIFAVADTGHEPDETHGLARIEQLAKEALALLPCETCNGAGEIPQEVSNCSCVYCSNGLDGCQVKIPCPDCQPHKTRNGKHKDCYNEKNDFAKQYKGIGTMKEFRRHWNKEIRPYVHNPKDRELAEYWWEAALKWVKKQDEELCPKLPYSAIGQIIDKELEQ